MKEFVRRSFNFDIRAQEQENAGILTGRPIVYEQRTDLGFCDEMIARGALDGADLRDVRFLVNHDTKMIPLARSRRNNGNSTMKLSTDYEGLNIDEIRLDTVNNSTARALFSAVQRGDLTGMSFMFTIDDYEWQDVESEHPTRIVKKISAVYELSACTFPAYDQTEINARSKSELESLRSALESARQLHAKSVETDSSAGDLALARAIFDFKYKFGGN